MPTKSTKSTKSTKPTEKIFYSGKTFTHSLGLSCAFRQWRADSHCKYLHGYALEVSLMFGCDELDKRNWVVDFGSLKSFKQVLENTFDHKTVVARDDPQKVLFQELAKAKVIDMVEVEHTGCERFAEMIFDYAEIWLKDNGYHPRVWISGVEVREHGANSAWCYRKD